MSSDRIAPLDFLDELELPEVGVELLAVGDVGEIEGAGAE